MKRLLSYFTLMFCCFATVSAQQTSLIVDNQTPGWLSSKIPFADQATVKNLKVTGYLNGTDLKFIYELSKLRELVHLDLSDANIVAGGDKYGQLNDKDAQDNVWTNDIFYTLYSEGGEIGLFLSIPKTIEKLNLSSMPINVDTLFIGGISLPAISNTRLGMNFKYLHFREGVETISNNQTYSQKVHLPTTIKKIGKNAFCYYNSDSPSGIETIDVNLPNSIENLNHGAFMHLYLKSDTIRLPEKMETWNPCSFELRKGQVVYIPENIKEINNACTGNACNNNISSLTEIEMYVESIIPPNVRHFSGDEDAFSSCTVYVPAGSVEAYKNSDVWKSATIIEEEIPVTGISINKPKANVYVDDKVKLDVVINPDNANNKNFTLKSLDENVAIVDEQGNVEAKAYGKARIMATSEDGEFTDVCEFDVYEHAMGVNLNASNLRLKIGENQTLIATILPEGKTDGKVEWNSSDTDIAEVDTEGVVKAKAKGKATITVTTVDGGHTASCEIQVYQPVASLSLNNETLTLKTGETQQLIASVLPSDADNKNVIWSSENENIARVDKDGKITGVKAGQVWIYAKSEDDETVKTGCYVTVIQPVTGLTLDKSSIAFSQIGESEQLTAIVQPEDATNKDVNWTSSDQAVAIVSNGLVVCSGFGAAVIYVTTVDGGYMATCVVNAAPASGIDDVSTGSNIQIENGHILLNGLAIGTNVTVCDTAGRVLYSTKINASGCVDIPNIGRGIFIIKIRNNAYKVVL